MEDWYGADYGIEESFTFLFGCSVEKEGGWTYKQIEMSRTVLAHLLKSFRVLGRSGDLLRVFYPIPCHSII